jgi:thiosulfate dehydrogenase
MIKGIVIGFVLAIVILGAGGFAYFSLGMAPTATADPPFPFEEKVAGVALKARIQKADVQPSPVDASEETFVAGAKIYRERCGVCHGFPGYDSDIANGMFPKPSQLFRGTHHYMNPPDSYWRTKNGIRMTGMPSFDKILSDTQIWQVSELLFHRRTISREIRHELLVDLQLPPERKHSSPRGNSASDKEVSQTTAEK